MKEQIITEEYLKNNPNHIFVFGDNLHRRGTGGAAKLRHCKNTYGFITKINPYHKPDSYYKPEEYMSVFKEEMKKLTKLINKNPMKIFLISKVGSELANKYGIYEAVIKDEIQDLKLYSNVKFLYED